MKRFDIFCNDEHQTQWCAETAEEAVTGWGRQNHARPGTVIKVREHPRKSLRAFVLQSGDNPATPQIETSWWLRILRTGDKHG